MAEGRVTESAADGSDSDGGVDVAALLGSDDETFDSALSDRTGPVAVVGDPFAGRETVLDAAAERLDAVRIRLRPDDDAADRLTALGDGPVVVDGCQHLYRRAVGGFDLLDRFLNWLVGRDAPVVTGWNRYAWTYLDTTQGVGREFPVTVELRPLGASELADAILCRYEDTARFLADDAERGSVVSIRHRPVEWRGISRSIPYPVVNIPGVGTAGRDGDLDPKDVVFERLAAVSNGNVGVAAGIWERQRGDELRPSDVVAAGADLTLDRDEAFCLRIVLAKESVSRAELAEIVGDGLDRVLGRLVRDELVTVEDDRVNLAPAAVPSVVAATERERIL